MTPCEKYWEALNAFVDGECSPEEEAELRAHLLECEACREALADLTAMRDGFPSWEEEAVPEGFADGILQTVAGTPQQQPKKAKKRGRSAAWASLAACLGLMVLLGTLFPGSRGASTANNAAPASGAAVTASQAAESQSGEGENDRAPEGSDAYSGQAWEDQQTLLAKRDILAQADADLCWTLTEDEELNLLSGRTAEITAEGRVYTLTMAELTELQARAAEADIALDLPGTGPASTAAASGNPLDPADPSPGEKSQGESAYRVLVRPAEEP